MSIGKSEKFVAITTTYVQKAGPERGYPSVLGGISLIAIRGLAREAIQWFTIGTAGRLAPRLTPPRTRGGSTRSAAHVPQDHAPRARRTGREGGRGPRAAAAAAARRA